MCKYIVYKTTCLINNKIYIGVHKTENPDIFDGYLGRGFKIGETKYLKNPIAPFHHAIVKYGQENFKRETLFVFNTEDEAYNKEAEIVDLDFINRNDTYNVALGGKCRPKPFKPVYMFDYEGNLIQEFSSALEGAKTFDGVHTCIYTAIKIKHSVYGKLWSYENKINVNEYTFKIYNHYYLYDSNGFFYTDFDTQKECVEFLNTNVGNLSRAVKSKIKIAGFFICTEYYDKIQIVVTKLSGKLNRYTLDGQYIDSFKTVKEAKEKLGLNLTSISQAIKLNRQCNGYRWTRTDNPSPIIEVPENPSAKRPVYQLDKQGNIIKEFESVSEAEKVYSGVRSVLKGSSNQAHGYKFAYKDEFKTNF